MVCPLTCRQAMKWWTGSPPRAPKPWICAFYVYPVYATFLSLPTYLIVMTTDYNDGTPVHKGGVGVQMAGFRKSDLC
jgi:hypothetical protein